MKRGRPVTRPRAGTSIVELMVAVVILGVAGTGIAAMAFHAGKSTDIAERSALRDAALGRIIERVSSTPYAELPSLAGCDDGGDEHFSYLACVRVEQDGPNLREVTVHLEDESHKVPSVSRYLQRARTAPESPF